MSSFDSILFSLSLTDNTWNDANWEYTGVKDIRPSLEGLPEKEQLRMMRKNLGRYAEWHCKAPGRQWKTMRLVEDPDGNVRMETNWHLSQDGREVMNDME